jgi:hypothetical protein
MANRRMVAAQSKESNMARHKRTPLIAALTLVLVVGAGIGAALAFAKQPSPAGGSGTSPLLNTIAPKTVATGLGALPGSRAEEIRDMAPQTTAGRLGETHEPQPLGATTSAATGTASTGLPREETTETPPRNPVAALTERNEP